MVQTNHVSIGSFLTDLDKRVVSTSASIQSKAWINLGPRKSATPTATLDGVQEVVISPDVVDGKARPLYIYSERKDVSSTAS